jgi:hypothetical protein
LEKSQGCHHFLTQTFKGYQLLQKIRFIAKNIANDQSDNIKDNFDKSALPHAFQVKDFWVKTQI